jgi:hypothetical protein
MSNKTKTLAVRLSAQTASAIKQIAVSQGRTPSDLLGQYAEEAARQHNFCHIEFRDTPLGRMAYVEGTRTAVWLIADLVHQHRGSVKKVVTIHFSPKQKFAPSSIKRRRFARKLSRSSSEQAASHSRISSV